MNTASGPRLSNVLGANLCLFIAIVSVLAIPANNVEAQVFMAVDAAESTPDDDPTLEGFELGLDESMQSVVEDFQRYARRGLWEKAIETLENVDSEKLNKALLASEDGFVMPAGEQLWRLQANLSGEFREAFRVFLNAKARKLFDEAMAEGVRPKDRDAKLTELYQTYFVSSVGDEASNLLGDRAFREGQFSEAVRHWQHVLDYHPDSELGEAWLVFKIGVAATQLEDRDLLAGSLRTLSERFPTEVVTFAGREVSALDTLKSLAEKSQNTSENDRATGNASRSNQRPADGLRVPETLEIEWQHELATEATVKKLASSEQQYWRYKGIANLVVPASIDGSNLVYNYFGSTSCIDLETGKLEWRHNSPEEAVEKISGNIYRFSVDIYGIGAGAGQAVSQYIPPDEMNYYRAGADLVVYDIKSGKQKWDVGLAKRGQSDWFHIGKPFVAEGSADGTPTTYVLAIKSGGGEPYLRVHKGKEKPAHEIRLGRYREIDVEDYNDKLIPSPKIVGETADGYLLIAIDEGALIAVDVENESVAWAYRYSAPRMRKTNNNYQQGRTTETTLHPRSSPYRIGSTIYLKDSGRPWLVALDLDKRRPVWQRRIATTCEVVAHDESRLYLLGEEMLAIDRESGELKWAARLPMQNSGLSSVIVGDSILVFTGRGLYELNRSDGSVVRIHREVEFDSNGGRILLTGDRLVTISERNITAWKLGRAADTSKDTQ